jgi:hypothetical protein
LPFATAHASDIPASDQAEICLASMTLFSTMVTTDIGRLKTFAVAQWAATPHMHATAKSGGHSHSPGEAPHVHLTTDDSSHCHGGHSHSHHHAAKPPLVASVDSKTQQAATPIGFTASPSGHGDDAIYLPSLTTPTPRDIAGLDSPAMVGEGLVSEPAPRHWEWSNAMRLRLEFHRFMVAAALCVWLYTVHASDPISGALRERILRSSFETTLARSAGSAVNP